MSIKESFLKVKREIPHHVKIVLAAKMRMPEEVKQAISAGAEIIGENYVQEAEKMKHVLEEKAKIVKWHMIGALQKNKINKALRIFDCIQTVDSVELAEALNKRAEVIDKKMSVFIEINIGSEITKSGIPPDYKTLERLVIHISRMNHLKLEGLMTMGPLTGRAEGVRPFFRKAKMFFDKLKSLNIDNVDLKYLSMGMSNSYRVAIEEGANMVRLGTVIFGNRTYDLKT